MQCLNDMLDRNARVLREKPFIVAEDEVLSYGQFERRVSRLAHVLARHGVGKGDAVGLYLPSRVLMVVGFWACQKLGAVPVPVSAMCRETELRNVVQATQMRTMLADAQTVRWLRSSSLDAALTVLVDGAATGNEIALAERLAASPDRHDSCRSEPDDVAAVFFTSGTSGAPKGAVQTQLNQYSTLRDMMVAHQSRFASEVYYCAAPLFSNLGMTVTVNLCMFSGGTVVLNERWDTERVLEAIARHRVTILPGTPTMFVYMVNAFDPARHDLSSLRLCTNGGAPVSPEICRRFEAISGARVIQVYGATESLGQNAMEPVTGIRKSGSAGLPVGSSRIEVVDDAGRVVPAGVIGEVVISGDCVARGYWGDAPSGKSSFTPRGWMSGDLGYLDEDGYLFIVDRKKDVIIAGGHNIYPLEVENVLYRHEAVAMCAVVGIPDEAKGEIPVAVVVRKPGADCTEADLIAFCREHMSVYKAPRKVGFVNEMPIHAGKIMRRELVRRIREEGLASRSPA